ncbi:MAG: translation initiation factor IF-3 [Patescibacteria group bacterium]
MRISKKKRPEKPLIPQYKKNHSIEADQLLVLDEENQNLGIKSKAEALALAEERELDLVEINPKSNPPVVKLIDFTEFKYQKEKEVRKQKAHSRISETKGIRLSPRISDHDLEIKRIQAEKFLNRGDKVKIELTLKGRENAHVDVAISTVSSFITKIAEKIDIREEQKVEKQDKKITAILVKK